jgi:hypothetical protein
MRPLLCNGTINTSAATDMHAKIELLEAVFPAWSLFTVPLPSNGRIYKFHCSGLSAVTSHFVEV